MKRLAMIRIRFPRAIVERLDGIAATVRETTRRRIPRAAVVRALVALALRKHPLPADISVVVAQDTVKRGRTRGYSPRKAVTS